MNKSVRFLLYSAYTCPNCIPKNDIILRHRLLIYNSIILAALKQCIDKYKFSMNSTEPTEYIFKWFYEIYYDMRLNHKTVLCYILVCCSIVLFLPIYFVRKARTINYLLRKLSHIFISILSLIQFHM